MGERLKSTEASLSEDRARQEQAILKLLKQRQKKNLKQTIKQLNQNREELFQQIDDLKSKVDEHKAQVYAQQGLSGQSGLVSDALKKKVESICNQSIELSGGAAMFNGDLDEKELDDLRIERAQLLMQKEKELKAIDVQVEEELDA